MEPGHLESPNDQEPVPASAANPRRRVLVAFAALGALAALLVAVKAGLGMSGLGGVVNPRPTPTTKATLAASFLMKIEDSAVATAPITGMPGTYQVRAVLTNRGDHPVRIRSMTFLGSGQTYQANDPAARLAPGQRLRLCFDPQNEEACDLTFLISDPRQGMPAGADYAELKIVFTDSSEMRTQVPVALPEPSTTL